ncbi:PREDICTED: uncharacterized protein LOC105312133 [Amphimedon queenslandica]|uniref:CCDC92/74 N-terminal domain-containing protein n=1 Tax=Amphimedon queenslandica TaxID=400682 RepID=A0A1X7V974_AMPQE|nr:PREDICTED: uncharacterized protein LOC105312133 [Amphimedon queenslandica]|eukprot:XP_011402829.1 PREDICTED: uncharacterized protein LOC105312133 [Amphimedon queenslandica]
MAARASLEGSWTYRGPSWRRSGLTGGGGAGVRGFGRELSSLPHDSLTNNGLVTSGAANISSKGGKQTEKVKNLERTVDFLKVQHKDTLQQLHTELERLKVENKELNFRLVMCRCGLSSHSKRSLLTREKERSRPQSQRKEFEMMKELQRSLKNERMRNDRLMKMIEQKVQHSFEPSDIDCPMSVDYKEQEDFPLSMSECKRLIKDLRAINQQQSHELFQLKADLEDLLYSEKWTPDAYLIARAYIPPTGAEDKEDADDTINTKLPQIVRRNDTVKEKAYRRLHESVHLPALKPRLSTLFSERHKRSVSLQRNKVTGCL